MKKLDICHDLQTRQYTSPNGFIWKLYNLVATVLFKKKYNLHFNIIDDINDCKGPCFIIWNHLSRRDHIITKLITAPRKYNMMAGYSEFFKSHLHFVFKIVKVIPKKNFTNDLPSIKAVAKAIRRGQTICFSPEGMSSIYGQNQPIVPGTGRFLQSFHIPVYFIRMDGSYLMSNKTDITDRPGYVSASIERLFDGEDLLNMTPAEIEDIINTRFRTDEYAWNQEHHYHYRSFGKNTSNLETLLYRCPKCGKEFCMNTHDNEIVCTSCGNGATMDDTYVWTPLHEDDVLPASPSVWFLNQRKVIIDEIRENPEYAFEEQVHIENIPNDHYLKGKDALGEPCGEGTLRFDHSGIHYNGTKHGEPWSFTLTWKSIYTLVIENDCTMVQMYVNEEHYNFIPAKPSVGKMLLVSEEMHRYHYNVWKNFKWFDYLYEGKELGVDAE